MNATETVALDIIGDLLKTESERKHQLEYANAGRNQITINTDDGRQAQFVKNEQGKIFLLVDGVVYPIAQNLVNEATGGIKQTYTNYTNTNSNAEEVENWINNPETVRYKETYYVKSGGEFINNISQNLGIPKDYIGNENYMRLPKRFHDNRVKIKAGTKLTVAKEYYKTSICTPIVFKWVRDLDGSGYVSFDEFKQIQNTFYDNENFLIAIAYSTDKFAEGQIKFELLNNYTGELIRQYERDATKNHRGIEYFSISSNELPIGTYTVNAKLLNSSSQTYASNNTILNIKEGNSSTREISNWEKSVKEKINNSTPKGIFFYNSWDDLNNNNMYDYNEFSGLNKSSYNLSTEVMKIGINYPNKSGEIIIQSWTKDGELLGTTTNNYQRVSGHWAGKGGNPYTSMDFIDMIQIRGAGEYKISVTFIEGGTYEQELIITE